LPHGCGNGFIPISPLWGLGSPFFRRSLSDFCHKIYASKKQQRNFTQANKKANALIKRAFAIYDMLLHIVFSIEVDPETFVVEETFVVVDTAVEIHLVADSS